MPSPLRRLAAWFRQLRPLASGDICIDMGNTDASRIMSSDIITFLIGPDEKEFKIHSARVKSLAKKLRVETQAVEGPERCIRYDDRVCDEETFIAFSEFAYTGKYSAPEFNDILPRIVGSTPSTSDIDRLDGGSALDKDTDQLDGGSAFDPERVQDGGSDPSTPKTVQPEDDSTPDHQKLTRVDKDTPWSRDFSSKHDDVAPEKKTKEYLDRLLMFHGKVYHFANDNGINSLEELSLGRLQKVIDLIDHNGEDIEAFTRFFREFYYKEKAPEK